MLELCPTSLKFYPVKKEKQVFDKFGNKILNIPNRYQERIVLTNVVYGIYIPHLEEILSR